jgi:integrase
VNPSASSLLGFWDGRYLERLTVRRLPTPPFKHAPWRSPRVHPKVVSEALGHASIGVTLDTYSHVMPSMSQVAADAINAVFGE